MNKHTKSISLVLLGSALMVSGCSSGYTEGEEQGGADWGEAQAEETRGRSAVGVGTGIGLGRMFSRGMGGGRSVGVAPSARGGFGRSGGFSAGA